MSDLCAGLKGLATDATVPNKQRQRATALLQRLAAPIKVGIGGPDAALAGNLRETLSLTLEGTVISDQVSKADIGVWCTQSFGPDEVTFWEAAPAALQDHSLLVGPDSTFIQDMGAVFFRQYCHANAVADVLLRQLHQGREADADQAFALLDRYGRAQKPSTPAPSSTGCDMRRKINAYLQTRADALAALEVQDTPESCAAILAHCAQTAADLSDMVAALPDKGLHSAAFDAVDQITLMRLEGDVAAATDAVTTLVALKSTLGESVRQIETISVP